jgi:hypothetical protein
MNNYPVLPGNTYNITVGTAGVSGRKNWNTTSPNGPFSNATLTQGGGSSSIRFGPVTILSAGGGHEGAGTGYGGSTYGGGSEPFQASYNYINPTPSTAAQAPFASTVGLAGGTAFSGGGSGGSAGSGGNPAGGMTNGVQNNLTIGGGGGGSAGKYTGNGPNGSPGNPAPPRRFRGRQGAGSGVFGQGVVPTTFDVYGKGGGGASIAGANAASGGAVRIVWPGVDRQFPNVNILDLPVIP